MAVSSSRPRKPRPADFGGPLNRELICRALIGAAWPARAADLVRHAREHASRSDVIGMLSALPDGVYLGPNQVSRALFGPHGHTQLSP